MFCYDPLPSVGPWTQACEDWGNTCTWRMLSGKVWVMAAVLTRAGSIINVLGRGHSPGTDLLSIPNPGTEHVLVLRLQSFLGPTVSCRVLPLEGGVQVPTGTCTYPASIPCPRESYIKQ